MIGDSYVEGYMTDEAKLITTILSERQGQTVANLGHAGYGPQQELAVLKRYGLPLQPKTIIWAFFEGNDLSDAEHYDPVGQEIWQDFWFRSLTRNISAFMLRPPQECVPNARIQQLRADFIDARNMATPVFFAPTEVESYSETLLHKAVDPIVEAARLCQERHIRFMVVFVPEKYRVYHDLKNVALRTADIRSWEVSTLPAQLHERLVSLSPSIEYLDLTSALKAVSQNGIATYLSDDTHWTEAGNRVAAEAIHRALLNKSTPLDRAL